VNNETTVTEDITLKRLMHYICILYSMLH